MLGTNHRSSSTFVRLLSLVVFAGTLLWCSEGLARNPRVWADQAPGGTIPPAIGRVYLPLVTKPAVQQNSDSATIHQRIVFVSRQKQKEKICKITRKRDGKDDDDVC